jgi:hypothetical protein
VEAVMAPHKMYEEMQKRKRQSKVTSFITKFSNLSFTMLSYHCDNFQPGTQSSSQLMPILIV